MAAALAAREALVDDVLERLRQRQHGGGGDQQREQRDEHARAVRREGMAAARAAVLGSCPWVVQEVGCSRNLSLPKFSSHHMRKSLGQAVERIAKRRRPLRSKRKCPIHAKL